MEQAQRCRGLVSAPVHLRLSVGARLNKSLTDPFSIARPQQLWISDGLSAEETSDRTSVLRKHQTKSVFVGKQEPQDHLQVIQTHFPGFSTERGRRLNTAHG